MTLPRWLPVLSAALLSAGPATADDPAAIFRFKEYAHPVPRSKSATVFSPDGKLMAAADSASIAVWEAATGKSVARFELPRSQNLVRLVFTADGKTLVSDGNDDNAVRFWEIRTGKQVRELAYPKDRQILSPRLPAVFAFSPGVKHLLFFGVAPPRLCVHDANAKALCELDRTSSPWGVAFSPNADLMAYTSGAGGLQLLDMITGKKLQQLVPDSPLDVLHLGVASFSPDGRYVAQGVPDRNGDPTRRHLTVWRVADGKQCARVFTDHGFSSSAFAGNGRTLAATGGPHGVYLYDLATDTLYLSKLRPEVIYSVIVSADGSTLAFIAGDSERKLTIHVMPCPKYDDDSFGPTGPTDKQLAECWDGLVGDNEFRRAHEIARLRPHADWVVALARERVKPVPDLFRQRAEDLIENLDSPDIRDKVTENLHLMAHDFEPLLESALKKAPEGDVRNRLTAVLKKAKESPTPEKLTAAVRAVEVLERLDTPAATKALEELAAGAVGAKVTAEAAAALKRNADKPRGRN